MKQRILIVEDERRLWAYLREALETASYELEWVQTGHEAVRRSLDNTFDIVVLDMELVDTNAWNVLDCLCRLHPFTAIIVLVHNIEESEIAAVVGASACLLKPVERMALLKAIRRLLAEPTQERVCRSMEARSRVRFPESNAALCQ